MRHKGVDKEATRQKVLEAASRHFRKYGYAGIGIDALAKGAGVTSGAIYAHFGSKAEVFNLVLDAGLNEVIEWLPTAQAQDGDQWLNDFVDYYLGVKHRSDAEHVCAMASLTPEVIHFGGDAQASYEEKMLRIANIIAGGLPGAAKGDLSKAWVILSLLTGGVNISRAMKTNVVAEDIATAVKASVKGII